jgi:hypothetical protein
MSKMHYFLTNLCLLYGLGASIQELPRREVLRNLVSGIKEFS